MIKRIKICKISPAKYLDKRTEIESKDFLNFLFDFFGIKTSKLLSISLVSFKKKNEINITDKIPIVKFPNVLPTEFKISGKNVKSILFNQFKLKIELSKLNP